MNIRLYVPADYPEWLRMRNALWPGQTEEDMVAWLARTDAAVFVAERDPAGLCGFAEAGARAYADGCETSPVAYWKGGTSMRTCGSGGSGRPWSAPSKPGPGSTVTTSWAPTPSWRIESPSRRTSGWAFWKSSR